MWTLQVSVPGTARPNFSHSHVCPCAICRRCSYDASRGFHLGLSALVLSHSLSSSSRGRWTSTVNCPYGGTVPVHQAHIATCLGASNGCVVSNVFEVWNWSQMLNNAVGTSRLSVCVCESEKDCVRERQRDMSCPGIIRAIQEWCDISQPCCWCLLIVSKYIYILKMFSVMQESVKSAYVLQPECSRSYSFHIHFE